jgi:hypothetical protein
VHSGSSFASATRLQDNPPHVPPSCIGCFCAEVDWAKAQAATSKLAATQPTKKFRVFIGNSIFRTSGYDYNSRCGVWSA